MLTDVADEKNRWAPLLKAVGLPESPKDVDETMEVTLRQMEIAEFRELVKVQGPRPGYYDVPGVCLAGSSVMSWVLKGMHEDEFAKDHDYFPEDVEAAQAFVDFLIKKGFALSGFQGRQLILGEFFGVLETEPVWFFKPANRVVWEDRWMPDPHRIAEWYGELVGRTKLGKHLPEALDPVAQLPPEETVRALNFRYSTQVPTRQLILVIRGTPMEVIDTFDFSMIQWAMDKDNIYWGKYTIQTMVRKRVRINRIHHPMSTFRRMLKYSNRGWYFCLGTCLEIARGLAHWADKREAAGLNPLEDLTISLD